MIVTLAMVASINGKTTKGDLPDQSWASKEDQNHLSKLIGNSDAIIMGSNTYQIAKSHIKPKPGKLRIIMTRSVDKFDSDKVPGQLEFSSEEPESLIKRLGQEGYDNILLLSGHKLNKSFFEKKLIDKLILTIEPKIFGSGFEILDNTDVNINLNLLSIEKLNDQGTVVLSYEIIK